MVAQAGPTAMSAPLDAEHVRLLGKPRSSGILIIADHASAHVPDDIMLGISPDLLATHIALDIGVEPVAQLLLERGSADAAIMGAVSRLVIDMNRDVDAPGLIPEASDGHPIPGNRLDQDDRSSRIARFYHPYHAQIAQLIAVARPLMILSLHSFTPALSSREERRPWELGVLYNDDDRLARLAIPLFADAGLLVGDQLPYSGKQLNHTMNRHAEANNIPYLGLEMRQDLVGTQAGQARFAEMIAQILEKCRNHLAP